MPLIDPKFENAAQTLANADDEVLQTAGMVALMRLNTLKRRLLGESGTKTLTPLDEKSSKFQPLKILENVNNKTNNDTTRASSSLDGLFQAVEDLSISAKPEVPKHSDFLNTSGVPKQLNPFLDDSFKSNISSQIFTPVVPQIPVSIQGKPMVETKFKSLLDTPNIEKPVPPKGATGSEPLPTLEKTEDSWTFSKFSTNRKSVVSPDLNQRFSTPYDSTVLNLSSTQRVPLVPKTSERKCSPINKSVVPKTPTTDRTVVPKISELTRQTNELKLESAQKQERLDLLEKQLQAYEKKIDGLVLERKFEFKNDSYKLEQTFNTYDNRKFFSSNTYVYQPQTIRMDSRFLQFNSMPAVTSPRSSGGGCSCRQIQCGDRRCGCRKQGMSCGGGCLCSGRGGWCLNR